MKILVINAGSSSLKYQLIDMEKEEAIAKGGCERIGIEGSLLKHKSFKGETVIEEYMPDHKVALELVLKVLVDKDFGAISSMDEIDAVGHRVLHSGGDFDGSVVVDDNVLAICKKNEELGPLHMKANITGIEACQAVMPKTPMVAVFDTTFHSTMPAYAYMYGIDYNDYKDYKVRKYGFHGTSHMFVSQETIKYLGLQNKNSKIITCHLGNGSSISAIENGKCVDTTMGFTPLEGMLMGTRSGVIDPAAVEFLAKKKGFTMAEVVNYLNKKSGVQGISGISSDFRDLIKAKEEGNERAELALDMFNYQCKKYVGSYMAAMGGVDCIVFTAGIGENTPTVRAGILDGLEAFGIKYDAEKNNKRENGIRDITGEGSSVKVLIIPTNEELAIARETLQLIK